MRRDRDLGPGRTGRGMVRVGVGVKVGMEVVARGAGVRRIRGREEAGGKGHREDED